MAMCAEDRVLSSAGSPGGLRPHYKTKHPQKSLILHAQELQELLTLRQLWNVFENKVPFI